MKNDYILASATAASGLLATVDFKFVSEAFGLIGNVGFAIGSCYGAYKIISKFVKQKTDYRQRMEIEINELDTKLSKAAKYLETHQDELLTEQVTAMQNYRDALSKRIIRERQNK